MEKMSVDGRRRRLSTHLARYDKENKETISRRLHHRRDSTIWKALLSRTLHHLTIPLEQKLREIALGIDRARKQKERGLSLPLKKRRKIQAGLCDRSDKKKEPKNLDITSPVYFWPTLGLNLQ